MRNSSSGCTFINGGVSHKVASSSHSSSSTSLDMKYKVAVVGGGYRQVAKGSGHTLALKADGTFDALNKKWFLDYKMGE